MKHVLVVGGGSIGERHVRCFLQTGRAKVSLCEVRDEIRERLASSYDLQAVYDNLDIGMGFSFDAAVICTPANLHISMALQLAKRGIHVLIEKPLSVSLSGIDELIAVRESDSVVVGVAYTFRHHPAMRALKQAIDSGEFGKPLQVVGVSGQHFPFYRPAYRETYYAQHQTGGGAIQDALTHMINAAEWLVGPITRLVADAEHCALADVTVEDTAHILSRHDLVLGSFSLNQHQMPQETHITVVCEHGTLRTDMVSSQFQVSREPGNPWETVSSFELERDDLFVAQAAAFLDAVDEQTEPACGLEDGIQTLKTNLAALRSVALKQWVNVIDD